MSTEIPRKNILDIPADDDIFAGKGHKRTSNLLADIIKNNTNQNFSIGLEGAWGVGKSSVIRMAEKKLQVEKSESEKYYFFTFDIWKSQGVDFRRYILEEFITWAIYKVGDKKKLTKLKEIQQDICCTNRETDTIISPRLSNYAILLLLMLPVSPALYSWLNHYIVGDPSIEPTQVFVYLLLYLFLILSIPFFISAVDLRSENRESVYKTYREIISKMLLSSRQTTDTKTSQRVRSTDPSNFEFNSTLKEILQIIQQGGTTVVFVLDNIDRLSNEQITEYWSLVRCIISRADYNEVKTKNTTLITIVPYDRNQINRIIPVQNNNFELPNERTYKGYQNLTPIIDRELFSKTFHEILSVPPPILSNAREFFQQHIRAATDCNSITDDEVLRSYRIFCHLLQLHGKMATPRQLILFVNELTMYFTLHKGRVKLPTIAAFLAHRDSLISDPIQIICGSMMDEQIIGFAADRSLGLNLASMVFNVSEDAALEILLDNRIAEAAVSKNFEELRALKNENGFDLRVDYVVSDNKDQWIATNELGRVIYNFSKCYSNIEENINLHFPKHLVNAFFEIKEILLSSDDYKLYLSIFNYIDNRKKQEILERMIKLSFEWKEKNNLSRQHGEQFVNFFKRCREILNGFGSRSNLKIDLSDYGVTGSWEFLFELGKYVWQADIGFQDFKSVSASKSEVSSFPSEMLLKFPEGADLALEQFQLVGLVEASDWVDISNACLEALQASETESQDIPELLLVICFCLLFCDDYNKSKIESKIAFESRYFYINLGSSETEFGRMNLVRAFFVAKELGLELLAEPDTIFGGDNMNFLNSEEFATYVVFKQICEGTIHLGDLQNDFIDLMESKKAIKSLSKS